MTTTGRKSELERASLAKLVDDLGMVQAQKADLGKVEDSIKREIMARQKDQHFQEAEGKLFRVKIVRSLRKILDMDAVRNKLTPQFISAHTREVESFFPRVSARKGVDLDELKKAARSK